MSSVDRLDQFFTPPDAARALLDLAPNLQDVKTVIDPACGAGSLLLSARERWPHARARGLDIDREVVAKLQEVQSTFDLTVGSLYPTVRVSREWMSRADHDLVLMNPPFTMENRRYVDVRFDGSQFRAGLAMAHITSALSYLRPRLGLLAVVPESALHSELDAALRSHLDASMELVVGDEISCNAFRGARVRSVLCGWFPRLFDAGKNGTTDRIPGRTELLYTPPHLTVEVSRGNLPVFRATKSRSGLRFVHSTHLSSIRHDRDIPTFRVTQHGTGQAEGNVVLLSRVGAPRQEHVTLVKLREPVQLSDCVIGLSARSWDDAKKVRQIIRENWRGFMDLYRGTGAPFITMARLFEWLKMNGIDVSAHSTSNDDFGPTYRK